MPAWWGRKSGNGKHREEEPQPGHGAFLKSHARGKLRDKPKSFDEVLRRDLAGGSAFSGFDSDGSQTHPLPRPSASLGNDHAAAGLGLGSGSVSSVSSSGSSDDHPIVNDAPHIGPVRAHSDPKFNMRPKSPNPMSRGPTSPSTSALHPMLPGVNTESPAGRHDDGRSQCHRLPLPPGSPAGSPSSLQSARSGSGSGEVSASVPSKWKKGKLLGRGSFGHVYIGFNCEGGQMCAIKEVRLVSDDHTSRESLKQLHQEINLLSQLTHQNIVRYYGSELIDDTLSVHLEYVSGGSIHKLLQDYGAFKEPVIQNYTRQILCGLAYLHGRNTVHRDIKGANILVDPNGGIKLADFGMAKHITNCASMLSFKGSPYWMAPEVVMNTNGYSLAVDIWSLGCTVLEMATSKPPWSQYEGVAAIFKIGNSKDMPEIPDHLSNDAKSFVRLCLQRDPSARPTASRLLDHPFLREQTNSRMANTVITKDAFPFAFDGSRTPPILESVVTPPSRYMRSPRENARTITSLPVSPCSSPLRQYGTAQRNFFLSPPHPSFAPMTQNNSSYQLRSNAMYGHDPLLLKPQAPGGSPRMRQI